MLINPNWNDDLVLEFVSRRGNIANISWEDEYGEYYTAKCKWEEIKHLKPKKGTRFIMKTKVRFVPLPKWNPKKDPEWQKFERKYMRILKQDETKSKNL